MSTEDFLVLTHPSAGKRLFYGDDPNQFGDLRVPEGAGPFPVVMNIHGGFWRAKYDLQHAGHLCVSLAKKGIATWNVEYRRVGNRGGGWPGTAYDIVSAYKYLQRNCNELKLDSRRILVMGHSAGGHLAFWLAANEPSVARVLGLAAVVDLQAAWSRHLSNDAVVGLLGGTPSQVPQIYADADPLHLSILHARQWLIHGERDLDVPMEQAQNYVRTKAAESVQFVSIPGADHYDLINPEASAWSTVERSICEGLADI